MSRGQDPADTLGPDVVDELQSDAALESHRPALQKLTNDLWDLEEDLFGGFNSRAEVIQWLQSTCIRTTGHTSDEWYRRFAREFRGVPSSEKERPLLAALLTEERRNRDVDEETAQRIRRRIASITLTRAYHRAFRDLRKDATEYVDNTEGKSGPSKHNPNVQRYIAMRPALNELDSTQKMVLQKLLDGFDSEDEILAWGGNLELASHGELDERFVPRCVNETSTLRMLTSDDPAFEASREHFAAHYLIPMFNAGARDLGGRAKETPDEIAQETSIPTG